MSIYPNDSKQEGQAHFCRLWIGQNQQLEQHLKRLSPQDRVWRFGSFVSDEFIHSYSRRNNFFNPLSVGYFVNGILRGAGEVHLLTDNRSLYHTRPWGSECEAAISVETAYQNQGIGSELFRRIVLLARNRGLYSLSMLCLADNIKIQKIARPYNAKFQRIDSQTEGVMHLELPNFFSVFEESMNNIMELMRMPVNHVAIQSEGNLGAITLSDHPISHPS